ncbi:DUF4170 domain-containing protein [Roseobacter sp.]|uniref:DUF4170 domain-containing protein n=1 Tax=Roseobacter sp. TaxID=1907202 RepID=UPI00385D81E6
MTQRLHLVFGGELVDPSKNVFKNVDDLHIVGIFPDYETAFNAWKGEAQRTVDNAHMRYFIAHLHRLRDEEAAASSTEELE